MAQPVYYARCAEPSDCQAKATAACGPNPKLLERSLPQSGGIVDTYACGGEKPAEELATGHSEPSTGASVVRALGAGAAAGGESLSNSARQMQAAPGRGCRNNLDCSMSQWCAKGSGKLEGVCADK